jgi:hypothetical protein
LCEVVVEEALDEPDFAFPEGSPESSSPVLLVEFDAELLPCADPPEAFELLLFVALPLSETLALFEPPLPPCAVALASPELPERADESPPELVEVALPVSPEVALLVALPPLAFWVCVTSPPSELLLLFAVDEFEDLHVPELELPEAPLPLDELVELDEHVAAKATSWCATICTATKAQAAVAIGMATLTNAFFAILNMSPGFLVGVAILPRRIDSAPMPWGEDRCGDVGCDVLVRGRNRGGPRPDVSSVKTALCAVRPASM